MSIPNYINTSGSTQQIDNNDLHLHKHLHFTNTNVGTINNQYMARTYSARINIIVICYTCCRRACVGNLHQIHKSSAEQPTTVLTKVCCIPTEVSNSCLLCNMARRKYTFDLPNQIPEVIRRTMTNIVSVSPVLCML